MILIKYISCNISNKNYISIYSLWNHNKKFHISDISHIISQISLTISLTISQISQIISQINQPNKNKIYKCNYYNNIYINMINLNINNNNINNKSEIIRKKL